MFRDVWLVWTNCWTNTYSTGNSKRHDHHLTSPYFTTTSGAWWRHQIETFSALLAICAGNSPVNGEFSAQRPVTRSFDVFFDLRLNKGLNKQSCGWWFETLSRSLWRHCNGAVKLWPLSDMWCHTGQLRPAILYQQTLAVCGGQHHGIRNGLSWDFKIGIRFIDIYQFRYMHHHKPFCFLEKVSRLFLCTCQL